MAGKTFVLTEDIDLSGYSSWTPIGNVTNFYNSTIDGYAFAGTLDGQGHVITGLTDSLFGYTDEANIRNLGIENYNEVVNTSTYVYGLGESHGSLIALAQNTDISNCYATGSISYSVSTESTSGTLSTDNIYIGGLIGYAIDNVNINNSHFSGDISVEHVMLTWKDVTIISKVYTGGLIGRIQQYSSISQATTINNSYVTGSISALAKATYKQETTSDYDNACAYSYAGGLVGNISVSDYSTNISNSYFNGSVSASARSDVNYTGDYWQEPGINEAYSGGLVGYIEQTWFPTYTIFSTTTISKSYAIGSVDTVLGSGNSGGLVGYLGDRGVFNIKDSYTSVSVSASSGYAGGIFGRADSDSGYYNTYTLNVQSSFALGESSGNTSGGIFGLNDSSHTNFSGVYYNSSKNTNYDITGITGVEESMFTANNIQIMGFTESKGWMYIDSSVLPQLKSQNEISNETLLKELLGDACADQTVVIETTSGTENIVISADDSIVEKLQEAGMIVGIEDGKVYISGGTNKILSVSEELFDALNLVATPAQSSGSGSNSGGNSGGNTTQISTIYISSSASNVALSSVGVNSTNYITVKNGSTTSVVTVDASTTVNQLSSALAGVGITTDVTNGKFTFSGDSTHYILGMTTNLKSALNLMDTGGVGYTIRTVETSSTQTVTLASANTDIQLGALGVTGSNFITVQNGTTTRTISVDSNTSLSDMVSLLANAGIAASVTGGKLTLSGDDSHYILGITDNLESALKLTAGSGKTYTTSTIKTTVTTPVETTVNVTQNVLMSEETLFSQLGMSGNQTITGVQNGKAFTISVTASDTVGDILGALGDYGLTASVRGGKRY